ncbi:unnamed protein product [Schistosoma curassoni]|uniref:DUF3265 domain-containing protein n=1 Tax=Schistosoma curassoni TaxID=6186 RepID=A0A183JTQ2_9TREM|nr:unnamed protein product [Schistosoma curassoni]
MALRSSPKGKGARFCIRITTNLLSRPASFDRTVATI